jgi:hypothetical protein
LRLLHGELTRLVSPTWLFICINGEKSLHTIWTELGKEFSEILNLCTAQTLKNATMIQEMKNPLTTGNEAPPVV